MMFHTGLSMLVFTAAWQKGKRWLYPAAILLHALADAPAGLYQVQGSPSVWVVEAWTFLLGMACLSLGIWQLKRYTDTEGEA